MAGKQNNLGSSKNTTSRMYSKSSMLNGNNLLEQSGHVPDYLIGEKVEAEPTRKGSGKGMQTSAQIVHGGMQFKTIEFAASTDMPDNDQLAQLRVIGTGGDGGLMIEHATGTVALRVYGPGEGLGGRQAGFSNGDNSEYVEFQDDDDGTYSFNSTEPLTVISSRKFKENIRDIPYGLEAIRNLRPVIFNKKRQKKVHLGLIAEEVTEIVPEVSDGTKVTYEELIPVLIRAVQELSQEVENLRMPLWKRILNKVI
jgi:hypothetical protein